MLPFKNKFPRPKFYKFLYASLILFTICTTHSLYLPELLYGDSLILRWDVNDEADLAGYNIYCDTSQTNYPSAVNLGNVTECDLSDLSLYENIPYEMALTAYDRYGNESDFSDPLYLTLDDGIDDFEDNCPDIYNPYQEDIYPPGGNDIGDACESINTPSAPSNTPTIPECYTASDCDDTVFCNGSEVCVRGRCQSSENPCGEGEECDEENDQCLDPCSFSIVPETSEVVSGQSLKFNIQTKGDCSNTTFEWSVDSTIGSSCDQDGNYVSGINKDFFNKTMDVVKVVEVTGGTSDEVNMVVSWGCFLLRLYGEGSDEIGLFRKFRNHFINRGLEGEEIIKFYYKWSPLLVKVIEEDEEIEKQLREVADTILFLVEEKTE